MLTLERLQELIVYAEDHPEWRTVMELKDGYESEPLNLQQLKELKEAWFAGT